MEVESVNHTHVEISQLIFLRGEGFSWRSAASHASITLEALVSGGLGKLWVTPRSASIYKTCLARVFPSQHSELICLCLAFRVPGVLQEDQGGTGKERHVWCSSSTPAWDHNLFVLLG